jgi:integrase
VVHHSASTFETDARSLEQEAYAEFAVARDDLGPAHGWCVDDLLCVTSSGHQLHASAFKRIAWLAWGVDPVTVQAWMGHASIATTNLYLHYLGTLPTGPD